MIAYAAFMPVMLAVMEIPGCLVALFLVSRLRARGMDPLGNMPSEKGYDPRAIGADNGNDEHGGASHSGSRAKADNGNHRGFNWELLHEVFLNPGLYLLFGGIVIGYISRLQGEKVVKDDDLMFVALFQAACACFCWRWGSRLASGCATWRRPASPSFFTR